MSQRIGKSATRAVLDGGGDVRVAGGRSGRVCAADVAVSPAVVTPGTATTVTITGAPGEYFAVVGSSAGAGFAYAGVQFSVGGDVRILAMGQLTANQVLLAIVPPFVGSSLDRYYIQVATSASPNFAPLLQVAPGHVLVNGDLSSLAADRPGWPGGPRGSGWVRPVRPARGGRVQWAQQGAGGC